MTPLTPLATGLYYQPKEVVAMYGHGIITEDALPEEWVLCSGGVVYIA